MALTFTQLGSEISTEKLVIRALQDDPVTYSEVIMEVVINDASNYFELQHLPILNTDDTFDFEINSIAKDYFSGEFLPLSGVNQTALDNALVHLVFRPVKPDGSVGAAELPITLVIKNITQDTFEIEDFDLTDYDCGDNGSAISKFLTSSPSPLPIGDLTSIHVSCLTTSYTGGVTPKQEWLVQTLLNGVLVGTTTEDVNVPDRGVTGFIVPAKFDIATYRFDFDSSLGIDEVRISVRDIASPFTARSETKAYSLRTDCEETITLSWLNELGAQDSYTFAGNINRIGKYTDSTFKRVRPVAPLSTDVGDLVYKSSYNYEYDIFSDRMPENNVQWLSNMLINKRAAIQSKAIKITLNDSLGLLYNWYSIDNGNGGNGTANGGIVNQSQPNWVVPSGLPLGEWDVLKTFILSNGGALKETGVINWTSPNNGATNSTKFNAIGAGARGGVSGVFFDINDNAYFITYEDAGGGNYVYFSLNYNNSNITATTNTLDFGSSMRLVRPAVGGENDGDLIPKAYVGNNGIVYSGIVIGSQVWLNENLYETKLNDGSTITNITDGTDWRNATTPSLCVYGNNSLSSSTPSKYFPIVITTEETTLQDKFSPETLFRLKFRLANARKGIK